MLLRVLNRFEEAVICLLLICTTLLVFIDVVMRFGFNSGFMWSQELTLHLSAWFVLLGASYGLKVGAHIGMDAFVGIFSRPLRRLFTAIAVILALLYCVLILIGSWIYLKKVKMIGIELEDLPVPAWIAHGILLAGFTLLTLRLLIVLWDLLVDKTDGFQHIDEAKESIGLVEELAKEEITS